MPDRFEDLRTYVAIVQTRSVAAAARRLGLAKSAVSRRLQELESRLGAQLLNRTTRTLRPTEAGQEFYNRALALLAELEEAEAAATQSTVDPAGQLRISAPMSFGALHLAPILCHYMQANPRLEVELVLDDRKVDLIGEGFDLAIRIAHLEDSNLAARRIAQIRRAACASPEYLQRHGTPKEPRDLSRHRGIAYVNSVDRNFWRFVNANTLEEQTADVVSPLRLNNGDAMREAAIAGYGVTCLPAFVIHNAVATGRLVPLLSPFEKPLINMYAVYPARRNAPAKVRTFVEFMLERFGDHPYWDRDVFGDRS